ncbi:MAG TPA: phosphoribosylglycinamide formyltransferase [Terriglobia bacterium]|nr:phosphoribosylglycinamide formyltransferase [Terriglobia bacterium]
MKVQPKNRRLGVMLSGRGSNFEAIADNIARGALDAEIAVVISNVESARGLAIARERAFDTVVIPSRGITRESFDAQVIEALNERNVGLVVLAGFMRVFSPRMTAAFPNLMVNIHPSLLPSFPGVDVQRQALEYGVKFSGCTVHLVTDTLDGGPILLQAAVPVLEDDTPDTLAERILNEEHRIYSEAIGLVLDGRFDLEGRRVRRMDL